MGTTTSQRLLPRTVAAGALALGLVAGGYGIATAANGSGSTTTTPSTTTPSTTTPALPALGRSGGAQGWGGQRSDETPLTGNALAAVTKAAQAKVPDATIVRVETDAEGHAAYEAHMTKADGSLVTVYVDASYNVVSVESR
jgi:hypothetical protein